uniref:Uncharacterized protein n=1 Tax=virus sp. ctqEG8 TaxID=2827998 RepID=A0A8S5REK2_9VIRU|nr:MAG TPA: hypothetical protein [virus sp. ctqEG8]
MTINEFSKVCKDFFAEHDDFKGVIHILNNKANDDGALIGFTGMKGTGAEILGMCLIMCDKAGISMREVALIAKNLANDPSAMAALANINSDSNDDDEDEKNDESPKKCCGECNRKEDSKEDGKPSREEIAKMLVDMLFGD